MSRETKRNSKRRKATFSEYLLGAKQRVVDFDSQIVTQSSLTACPGVASTTQQTGEFKIVSCSPNVWSWKAEPRKEDWRGQLCNNNKIEWKTKKDIRQGIKINCLLCPWLYALILPYCENHWDPLVEESSQAYLTYWIIPGWLRSFFYSRSAENIGVLFYFVFRNFKYLKLKVILFCSNMHED